MSTEQSQSIRNQRLPDQSGRQRPRGTIASLIFSIATLALFTWQLSGLVNNETQFQALNPLLAPIWKIIIVACLAAVVVCVLIARAMSQWTSAIAAVNALANLAFAGVIITLALMGELFAPGPTAEFGPGTDWADLREIFILLVVGVALWNSSDGVRRTRDQKTG
ncbi:hypothetical protein BAY61_18510 [Prauserella marina]|uniref:Uncharacterized protein n=1 Tax=Prauserella marina TaxID=530584 RepID=A0A222VRY7_9PSEU|nr:hypothetical protein [Prauserella marina]ASR36664.1 hypothetical protein BAY61_18510 [Prauserella marina]PWV74087.1 hypothetical protein DES30_108261 [Prauserella marina]SDD62710.1 hypothetical protein SAMN05421630_110262 [Prauserella marina]